MTTALWGWEFTQPQGAGQGASVTRRQESRLADSSAGGASDRVTYAPSRPHTSPLPSEAKDWAPQRLQGSWAGPLRVEGGVGCTCWAIRTLHMPLIFQERQGVSDSLGVLL